MYRLAELLNWSNSPGSNTEKSEKPKKKLTHNTPAIDSEAMQYSPVGGGEECDLVIGFDFGTSSTKVFIQAPDLPGSPRKPVDFGDLSYQGMNYVLPSLLSVSPEGQCSLQELPGYELKRDIKMDFLESVNDQEFQTNSPIEHNPKYVAICFLALVLRYSRKWYLNNTKELLQEFSRLNWSLNLGVPSPCIEDNLEHNELDRIGRASWLLSVKSEGKINITNAKKEYDNMQMDESYWDSCEEIICDFELFPEIAGAAVGYSLSDRRRDGLHAMIDIGSSTMDVCTFRLSKEKGDNKYEFFIADVKSLGAGQLFRNRLEAIRKAADRLANKMNQAYDPMTPVEFWHVPQELSEESISDELDTLTEELRKRIRHLLRKTIWATRDRRCPEDQAWKKGYYLTVLLTGGGSRHKYYRELIDELDGWLKENTKSNGVRLLEVTDSKYIQIPSENSGKERQEHLLAVAWGLSHRGMDIGKFYAADQIPDPPKPTVLDVENRYVSKDQC